MLHRSVTRGWRRPFRLGRLTDGRLAQLHRGVVTMIFTYIAHLVGQLNAMYSGINALLGGMV
jgi:hypothetical protein